MDRLMSVLRAMRDALLRRAQHAAMVIPVTTVGSMEKLSVTIRVLTKSDLLLAMPNRKPIAPLPLAKPSSPFQLRDKSENR